VTESSRAEAVSRPVLVQRLRAAGCVFAEDEAEVLLAAASDDAALERMVQRRSAGEPLEHVVGWASLCGIRVRVDPGVFVPRRRSELLVREALAVAAPDAVIVDLCCGSGAVGAVLAARLPGAEVYAADVDEPAVRCARRNLPPDRVFAGDLFDALPPHLRGRVDVLAVNAPYVPTGEIPFLPAEAREHEPAVALDGGADGLAVHRRVAAGASVWLAPGGHVLIETSAHQATGTATALTAAGFATQVAEDDDLAATVVIARRP
jgi:release factor glutamine methyltransferase